MGKPDEHVSVGNTEKASTILIEQPDGHPPLSLQDNVSRQKYNVWEEKNLVDG